MGVGVIFFGYMGTMKIWYVCYKIKDMEKGWDFAIQFIFILPKSGPHPVVTEATVGTAHAMLPSQSLTK